MHIATVCCVTPASENVLVRSQSGVTSLSRVVGTTTSWASAPTRCRQTLKAKASKAQGEMAFSKSLKYDNKPKHDNLPYTFYWTSVGFHPTEAFKYE